MMHGSPKQITWAESIQEKLISKIKNDINFSPLAPQIIGIYKSIDDASWWINTRNEFQSRPQILVFGLVALAQMGEEKACDEIINWQDDITLAPLFENLRITPEEA